jgi:hypothetical protein
VKDWLRLMTRGAYAGAALLGVTVVVLGSARLALVLVFVALGVLLQTIAETWGIAAAAPLGVLGLIFTAGGPVALAALVLTATAFLAVREAVRRSRRVERAHPGEES